MCKPSKLPNSEVNDENKPSRARSEVGRVAPATVPKVRPRATPAMILNVLTLIQIIDRLISLQLGELFPKRRIVS